MHYVSDNRILRQLVLLNHKVDSISSDVTKIIEKMTTDETIILEDTEIENYFPLKNDEELNDFELFLSDDRNHQKFVRYLIFKFKPYIDDEMFFTYLRFCI